jgi:protein TonB
MFQNLIESGSHRKDLARRGRFLLGTLALYCALIASAGVASVYAYNARLDAQTYEVTMLPAWALPAATHAVAPSNPPPSGHAHSTNVIPTRVQLFTDLTTPPRTPPPISTVYNPVPPVPPGPVQLGNTNTPIDGGLIGPGTPGAGNSAQVGGDGSNGTRTHVVVATEDVRPPVVVRATPVPARPSVLKVSQILNSKAVSKPVPLYPQIAKLAGVQGTVTVEILLDEQGRVISATAKDGPLMLREAARQAALLARFTPTQLNGEPVKVSGVISYNFMLR